MDDMEYKGYNIKLKESDGEWSYSIKKENTYGGVCSCYWCMGYWWPDEQSAIASAKATIDNDKFQIMNGVNVRWSKEYSMLIENKRKWSRIK